MQPTRLNVAVTLSALCLLSVFNSPLCWSRTAQPAFREKQIFKGKVSQQIIEAEQLMLKGKYDDAAKLFWQALNKNSQDVAARTGYGIAMAMQFKLDAADEQLAKAVTIDPNYALAHIGKALTSLYRLQSSSKTVLNQRRNILANAESECRFALSKDPGMAEAKIVLGMVLKEQGRLNEAAAQFQQAIQADKGYATAYAQLGLVQLRQGNAVAAADSFRQAIKIRSSSSTAHYGLGKALTALGNPDGAIKELNTALSLDRNSAPIHTTLGDVYRLQGNKVAAVKEYQAAIAIKAESEEAYLRLADVREERGDLELAIADLKSGLEVNPASIDLHRRIAEISLKLEKLDQAIKEYNTILAMNPGDAAAVKGLIRAFFVKTQKEASGAFFVSNNFEAAESQIQQAIRLNPNDMELRLADAKLRSLSGRSLDMNLAMMTPTNDAQRLAYAEALLAQNRYDEATQQMNIVIANMKDPKQLLSVADMCVLIKDLDSAAAAYQKAATFPEVQARAKLGIQNTARLREQANVDLRFAKDLEMKKQLPSAVDKFRLAAFKNPRLAEAQLGLAESLHKLYPKRPEALREASLHYKSYVALAKNLPEKERAKLLAKADDLVEKAYKIERKMAKH